jgi:site-specific DNA-cytosine methylase
VEDLRNSLYKDLLDIVINLKPEFVVCENVVGLRSMLQGKVEEMILEDFKEAGYEMNVTVLRAAKKEIGLYLSVIELIKKIIIQNLFYHLKIT